MSRTSVLVFAGVALGALFSFSAGAFPIASSDSQSAGNIILVLDGCGRGEQREHGRCVMDHEEEHRPEHRICPPHWHWSPFRDRCVHD